MHQRPAISELFCMAALRLKEASSKKYDVQIISLVSDTPSETVCMKYGIDIIPTCVGPLGKKMNTGITDLLQQYEFDYLLKIDDDDVVASNLLEVYTPLIKANVPLFGVKQVYFLDASGRRAIYFKYPYSVAKLLGCGKMISRQALEQTGWCAQFRPRSSHQVFGLDFRPTYTYMIPWYRAHYMQEMKYGDIIGHRKFNLFDDNQVRSLDYRSEMNFVGNGIMPVEVDTPLPMFTDVKTKVNIWKFSDYANTGNMVSVEQATAHWSDQEREYLKQLH